MSKILFIQPDSIIASHLRQNGAARSFGAIGEISMPDFSANSFDGGADGVDVVVLGSELEEPIQLTQKIHSFMKSVPVVILTTPANCPRITRAMRFAPLLGENTHCQVITNPEEAVTLIRECAEKSRKRRDFKTTLGALLAQQPPVQAKSLHPTDAILFERLLEHAPIGILSLDSDARIVTWNPKSIEILTASPQRLLGASLFEVLAGLSDHDQALIAQRLKDCSSPERSPPFIVRCEAPAGKIQWVELTITPFTARRRENAILVLIQDITDRKSAETGLKEALLRELDARKSLEAAHQRISFLSDATKALLGDLDFDTRIKKLSRLLVPRFADWCAIDLTTDGPELKRADIVCSDSRKDGIAEELTRKHRPDPKGSHPIFEVIRSGKSILVQTLTDQVLEDWAQCPEHLALLREMEMKSVLFVPLIARNGVFGVITLATADSGRSLSEDDRVMAEELAQRAALALENVKFFQESREAVKIRDEFISIASHELKTPITSLMLQNFLARRLFSSTDPGAPDLSRLNRIIETSSRQLNRLTRLIEDMLDVSRIATGRLTLDPVETDLKQIVREVCDQFEEQCLESGSELQFSEPDAAVIGLWDPYRIEQVIANLLTNALKYGAGNPIRISIGSDGAHAVVTVQDQGIGIAPIDQERIFNQFERAVPTSNISGFGLGLYITRKIVEEAGGKIRLESELGQGSAFTIELPLKPPEAPRSDSSERQAPNT